VIADSDALHARVRAFIAASMRRESTEPFDSLALAIAQLQSVFVPPIARLFRAHGFDPKTATSALAIPAVPVDLFRLARVAAHPQELDAALFRTSGTTSGARGEHAMRTTATYEAAALGWAERLLFTGIPRMKRTLILAPEKADDSSLGFMMRLFAKHLGGPVTFHVHDDVIDHEGVRKVAAEARANSEPTLVLGTSFAFVHLFDALGDEVLALPHGSAAMQTGGFKGRSREVPADALRSQIARSFAVDRVVGEYGMTELSSQLYDSDVPFLYAPPPWLRVDAADPATLKPLPAGEEGIARFTDLANIDSAVVIQTADRVRIGRGGGVTLLGRLPGAPPRGCSLAIDEAMGG
jgi:hypothetical protein